MTDFDYDCYIKKSIAHSAAKRKCGSKSKKCSLPSDHMTTKEWNERCGIVMSYQTRGPMAWADFQALPNDLKEEYLTKLIREYSVNAGNLAEMFGVKPASVLRVVKNQGLNVRFLRGKHPSEEQKEAFQNFMLGTPEQDACGIPGQDVESDMLADADEKNPDEVSGCEPEAIQTAQEKQATRLDSFSMSFSGEVNIDMIANSLKYILGAARSAKIQIVCELENI